MFGDFCLGEFSRVGATTPPQGEDKPSPIDTNLSGS